MKSKILVGVACFALGIGAVLATQKWIQSRSEQHAERPRDESPHLAMRDMDSLFDQFYNDDFFGRARDPFEEMRKMRERMMKEFDQPEQGGGIFDSWYRKRFGGGDAGEIKRREDKNFVYYDIAIKGVDKDRLKIKVEDGQVDISGQSVKKSQDANGTGSYFASTFHRSLPVPPEVDSSHVQIEQSGDTLTLKFPRA